MGARLTLTETQVSGTVVGPEVGAKIPKRAFIQAILNRPGGLIHRHTGGDVGAWAGPKPAGVLLHPLVHGGKDPIAIVMGIHHKSQAKLFRSEERRVGKE